MLVIFRFDENVNRFVSLLKLGQHWRGWSTRHDRQLIRATRVNSGGRDTTAVVAHMYWGIPVFEQMKRDPASWLRTRVVAMWWPQHQVG